MLFRSTDDGSKYYVKFKKGAKLNVPKAIAFDRSVAGQSQSQRFGSLPQRP